MLLLPALILAVQAGSIDLPLEQAFEAGQPAAGGTWIAHGADPWLGVAGSDGVWVRATQDVAGGQFGDGGRSPANNWLISEEHEGQQLWLTTLVYTEDDDTFGLILDYSASDTFYAALFTGGEAAERREGVGCERPAGLDCPGVAVVRVEGGAVEVLNWEPYAFPQERTLKVGMGRQDDKIWVRVWPSDDAAWGDHSFLMDAFDFTAGLGPGAVGLLSHGMGSATAPTLFRDVRLRAYDEDDDGVADDEDNCETVANPSQADGDGDGLGAACDEDEQTDPPEDDTGGADGGGPGDEPEPEEVEDPDEDGEDLDPEDPNVDAEGLTEGGAARGGEVSSCATAGPSGAGLGVALLALLGVTRRRR